MKKSKSFYQTEKRFSGQYAPSVADTILLIYTPFAGKIALCLVVGFAGRILLLSNTNIVGRWVDEIAKHGADSQTSKDYLLYLSIAAVMGFLLTLIYRIAFSRLSAIAVSQIYDEVTIRTSRFPMLFFDQTPTGRIITRFSSDYGNVFRLFGGPLAEFLGIIFDLVGMIILVAIASPLYLPWILIVGFFNYSLWKRNRNDLRQARRDLSTSRSPSIAHFAETAQGATTVRTFNREASFTERFYNLDQTYLDQKLKTIASLIRYSTKMNSLTALLLLTTGISAYFWLSNGWVSIGSLGVALGFIALSGTTVQMFFEWMAQFEEALVGMERLDHYLRMPIEPMACLPASSKVKTQHARYTPEQEEYAQKARLYPTAPRSLEVSLKNVWFRYQPDLPFVLKGLHLEIKAGERLGIIGRTGSGKSSLIQALFYLYPLSEGEIKIGSQNASLENLEIYRREMSFISQDSVLFRGSLRENLDLPGFKKDSDLIDALNRVGLSELATTEGLNLHVEERGRNLSLGEKQLVCMARCLLQDAPIVIMDEATSSVDPQSEEILVRATDEFFTGRTQIIIAHRLSTLKKCDRILWLDQGEIRMVGSPEQILHAFENQ